MEFTQKMFDAINTGQVSRIRVPDYHAAHNLHTGDIIEFFETKLNPVGTGHLRTGRKVRCLIIGKDGQVITIEKYREPDIKEKRKHGR